MTENRRFKSDIAQLKDMELERRPADEEEWHLLRELDSLGIEAKRMSELNDKQELQNLVENIKQTLYQEYKTHYSQH
jgi:hypothetical protein